MCTCPADWICCLRADCPRGERIRFEHERRMIEARRFLGDPSIVITLPPQHADGIK